MHFQICHLSYNIRLLLLMLSLMPNQVNIVQLWFLLLSLSGDDTILAMFCRFKICVCVMMWVWIDLHSAQQYLQVKLNQNRKKKATLVQQLLYNNCKTLHIHKWQQTVIQRWQKYRHRLLQHHDISDLKSISTVSLAKKRQNKHHHWHKYNARWAVCAVGRCCCCDSCGNASCIGSFCDVIVVVDSATE